MPRRIAIGQFHHETNAFASQRTGLADFERTGYVSSGASFAPFLETKTYVGGLVHEALRGERARGTEALPLVFADCTPSGLIADSAYRRIRDDMLARLRAHHPIDAVALSLHGSAQTQELDDPEGDLLAAIRELVGPTVPVVATLDLHANLSQTMLSAADALFAVNFYPHVDQFERGVEAIRFIHRMLDGDARPVMAFKSLPMHTPARSQLTSLEPARRFNERAWQWEGMTGVIDCSVYYGYRYADSPLVGTSVLAITDDDERLARSIADSLADEIWAAREEFRWHYPSPDEAVGRALAQSGSPVVIAETSDNPGGGAAGDATSLLGAILAADAALTEGTKMLDYDRPEHKRWACFAMMADKDSVNRCHAAGVGADVPLRLGAKTDDLHGRPLSVTARVRCLTDGRYRLSTRMGEGSRLDMGRTAGIVVGGVDVVLVEERQQVFDAEIFRLHGIEPAEYKVVGLKSSLHFYAGFEDMAADIIIAAGEGVTTPDFARLPFRRLRRPFWPIDY